MVPSVTILLENATTMWSTSHAFDNGKLMTCLRPQDLFVIYIAAIGHDVAHPGFTNVFMVSPDCKMSAWAVTELLFTEKCQGPSLRGFRQFSSRTDAHILTVTRYEAPWPRSPPRRDDRCIRSTIKEAPVRYRLGHRHECPQRLHAELWRAVNG